MPYQKASYLADVYHIVQPGRMATLCGKVGTDEGRQVTELPRGGELCAVCRRVVEAREKHGKVQR